MWPVCRSSRMARSAVSTAASDDRGPEAPPPVVRPARTRERTAIAVAATVMTAKPKRWLKTRPVLARALKTAAKVRSARAMSAARALANQRRPA